MEPITGWSQENRGYEVGLGQGQALGLDCSSSMSITTGQPIYIQYIRVASYSTGKKVCLCNRAHAEAKWQAKFPPFSPTAATCEWSIHFSNSITYTLQGDNIQFVRKREQRGKKIS